ncbi:MAG: beta-propeller fold lactonase family protein [Firmicutes bacterium]|nr:beta-propeller fold lactonase family protein [Bacillota bacterium]MCL2312255.1 beta-propeller fold lactonase family protein [Bacillota bacterium]
MKKFFVASCGNEKRLYACTMDKHGAMKTKYSIANNAFPTYLIRNRSYLFASLKRDPNDITSSGGIGIYKINGFNLRFRKMICYDSKVSYTHLVFEKRKKWIAAANYHSGSMEIFSMKNNAIFSYQAENESHIHYVGYLKNKKILYCLDLGKSEIVLFKSINNTFRSICCYSFSPHYKPRHMAVSKDEKYFYILNETPTCILVYHFDDLEFKLVQDIPCVPMCNTDSSQGAAIHFSPNQDFLLTSLRGHNSISFFKRNGVSGELSFIENRSTLGLEPRDFSLYKDKYLIVGNQASNEVICFSVNYKTVTLNEINRIYVERPSCIIF